MTLCACDPGLEEDRRLPLAEREPAPNLRTLLEAAAATAPTAPGVVPAVVADTNKGLSEASPHWPLRRFLTAEAERAAGIATARAGYRALAQWAVRDPYRDHWGGSGVAVVSLWRWLQTLAPGVPPDVDEARRALDVVDSLRSTRLARGMFESDDVLETLPQLEEDLTRRAATLAWAIGERKAARRLFLRYLTLTRAVETTPTEDAIMADVVSAGLASRDWLLVLRGRRLRAIGRYDVAIPLFAEARRSIDREARAASGLELAKIEPILDERKRGAERGRVADLLAAVLADAGDPEVAQDALYTRALVLNRAGPGRDQAAAERDLRTLVEDFPRGRYADNAIYELARQAEEAGDTVKAVEMYARLRAFEGPNDWIDSAHFRPALALYTRAGVGDAAQAAALLRDLVERYPSSPFRAKALFWRGRIAHETGDGAEARRLFEQVVRENSYDYYALRARMWLRLGAAARHELRLDQDSRQLLRDVYARGPAATGVVGGSPYAARVHGSIETGLYGDALGALSRLRERFPGQRLEELPLTDLDRAGALPSIVVLLSLRQDALAAADAVSAVDRRLALAAALGLAVHDWPIALHLVRASEEQWERRSALHRNAHFLATAYPPVFTDEIRRSARQHNVEPELVYAMIREESLFNPAALSQRGALGLFQFTPTTFAALDRKWRLLQSSRAGSREVFLLSPQLSIELGARWLDEELLQRQRRNIPLAVVEHNAGWAAVREWTRNWERLGRRDDIEYVVETIRFTETHLFTRRILADLVIVDAIGLFDDGGIPEAQ